MALPRFRGDSPCPVTLDLAARLPLSSDRHPLLVNTSDSAKIDGLGESLPELGYARDINVGPFYVWRHLVLPGPTARLSIARGFVESCPETTHRQHPRGLVLA